jgi:hypothetical protein
LYLTRGKRVNLNCTSARAPPRDPQAPDRLHPNNRRTFAFAKQSRRFGGGAKANRSEHHRTHALRLLSDKIKTSTKKCLEPWTRCRTRPWCRLKPWRGCRTGRRSRRHGCRCRGSGSGCRCWARCRCWCRCSCWRRSWRPATAYSGKDIDPAPTVHIVRRSPLAAAQRRNNDMSRIIQCIATRGDLVLQARDGRPQ